MPQALRSPEEGGTGGKALRTTHPEVLGVHVQLVTVQLGQLGVGALEVVQVLDGFPEGGEHLLAVGTHLGVAQDGRGAGQVPKVVEEPLCPGVDDQQPGDRQSTHRQVSARAWGQTEHTQTGLSPCLRVPGQRGRLRAAPTWPGPRRHIPPR
uniref:Uncharacterized protein n=1 Tax=Cyanoderma ruficeps TaxID=181631 RepID=A0A8C3NR86_9PASS